MSRSLAMPSVSAPRGGNVASCYYTLSSGQRRVDMFRDAKGAVRRTAPLSRSGLLGGLRRDGLGGDRLLGVFDERCSPRRVRLRRIGGDAHISFGVRLELVAELGRETRLLRTELRDVAARGHH